MARFAHDGEDSVGGQDLRLQVVLNLAGQAARFLAYHDTLTGLPNRRLLDDRLRQAIRLAQRRDRMVATLLVRLDDFRQLNDTLGHQFGDKILQVSAKIITWNLRVMDVAARYGGDDRRSHAPIVPDCGRLPPAQSQPLRRNHSIRAAGTTMLKPIRIPTSRPAACWMRPSTM